jgi:AraC-like DNA-binding protein
MAGLARLLPPPHLYVSLFVQVLALAVITVQFLAGIWKRMSSIKEVMKSGTIWTNVLLSVDALYPLLLLLNYSFYLLASAIAGTFEGLHSYIFLIVAALSLASLALRIYLDAAFVLWQQQERRIVESMKVTSVESAIDVSRIEDIYKDIYERVVAYFENEKPFLDNKLTINDVVRSLYTNKLYISRAISQFTGRNFCQFVNYYRVIYSMQCFRENPDLKIYELATMSGFNSIVSYNMAFRLFMGENPSEWCRKEKTRKIKNKK